MTLRSVVTSLTGAAPGPAAAPVEAARAPVEATRTVTAPRRRAGEVAGESTMAGGAVSYAGVVIMLGPVDTSVHAQL